MREKLPKNSSKRSSGDVKGSFDKPAENHRQKSGNFLIKI